jgi:hypothetical protein
MQKAKDHHCNISRHRFSAVVDVPLEYFVAGYTAYTAQCGKPITSKLKQIVPSAWRGELSSGAAALPKR